MDLGGYKTAVPKWDKNEATMLDQGIISETHGSPQRSRNWLLGHGGEYDMQTGKLVEKKEISKPQKSLVITITEV
jgi:hypothetical protein